ncbi:MAG TPA: metallopeptidase TldD-related protein [Gemmatimonadales bacterium]|nr:metallopeptidase TldD-related protein [Gemmatimonadales bacterium]
MSDARILSAEDCEALLARAHAFARGGGDTTIGVSSWWQGELRWARNRVALASDRRNIGVTVTRTVRGGHPGYVSTNQIDDVSLEAAVRAAERLSRLEARMGRGLGYFPPQPAYERPESTIWSDATPGLTTERSGEVARALIAPAEAKGLLSAGYLEVRVAAQALLGTDFPELRAGKHAFWHHPYVRWTQAYCSTTVRDPSGMASGWAGASSYDWARIDPAALAQRAVEKCLASRNPVALEPGRYTVILEPQAVADILEVLVGSFTSREFPEAGIDGPWRLGPDEALQLWRTKLGLRVVDERVTISHDLAHPDLGILTEPHEYPGPVTWIDQGVLTALAHQLPTAIQRLKGHHSLRGASGYRMSGGTSSVEEMIRTTKRGLLVTRFSNIRLLDGVSLLSTGLTRDGLWLVENGQITKAVKNFRFTESPLFVLNAIEQLGEPVRVFRPMRGEGEPLSPAIVPPVKARDFSFTSTIDAI